MHGPTLTLRPPEPGDAPALLELAGDPEVTRWFSWGPYASVDEPQDYIAHLEGQRARGEQLVLVVGRLGRERHEVGPGRRVPGAGAAAEVGAHRQRAEARDRAGVDERAAGGDGTGRGLAVGRVVARRPAVHVAADPGRVVEFAQPRHRFGRPAAEDRVVAAEQIALRAGRAHVIEDGLQRR
ncbi:MAG: hypothetical protein QOG35_2024 [Solirubrobacteraceae bacterium]|nr:hypothetical protein [Solirubrobacteraceae bacterium]